MTRHLIRRQSANPDAMWRRNPPFAVTVAGSAATCLYQGCGLLLGPDSWRSSDSYNVIEQVLPLRMWGAVFIAVAALLARGVMRDWRAVRFGAAAGLAVFLFWNIGFAVAMFTGDLHGVPATWIGMAVLLWVQTQGPNGGFARMAMNRDGAG